VHMDMPGWSNTYGLVSRVDLKGDKFSSEIQLNAYGNTSIAEMRMYPQDRSQRTMFAYSWPWVTTRFAGLSTNNSLDISEKSELSFGGSLGWNYNHSKYAEFNWIFHPGAPQEKSRFLPGLHAGYRLNLDEFNFSRSEEHTSELQSRENLVCRLLLEKKKKYIYQYSANH